MQAIAPIRTEEDLDRALARIDEIFDAAPGTPESDELDVLADLVELHESRDVPFGYPDPVAAIEFRMEQARLNRRDLIPLIGSSARVAEVLAGKRAITMAMARALHQHLGIPADVLLREPSRDPGVIDFLKFPLKELAKRNWIQDIPDLKGSAEELIRELMGRAGVQEAALAASYRKNDHQRINAKTDEYALRAWCWQVMAEANARPSVSPYEPGTVTPEFLRQVARLSPDEDGPRRARDFLAEHGIALEVVKHLPRTHLDGAALRLADGRPVIGLTLRDDRIDNFWFTLLHELAHVGLHLDGGEDISFVDDLTLRSEKGGDTHPKETQADERASEALIPQADWDGSRAWERPTGMAVLGLAHRAGVHAAIVAGRIRHETGNYRLLSQFVGAGQVRTQFEPTEQTQRIIGPG